MTSTVAPTSTTPQPRQAPPAAQELKCTLCGLAACWTKKDADEALPKR